MLLDILLHEPRQLNTIASHTPQWVWALLAGLLLLLGASQLRARRMSRVRAGVTPLAMALFSCIGVVSAFRGSGQLDVAIGLWMAACAACMGLLLWRMPRMPIGARFDPATRTCEIPGSAVPLALIIGIFLTKYVAGIELALQSGLIDDKHFVWSLATLLGCSAARSWPVAGACGAWPRRRRPSPISPCNPGCERSRPMLDNAILRHE